MPGIQIRISGHGARIAQRIRAAAEAKTAGPCPLVIERKVARCVVDLQIALDKPAVLDEKRRSVENRNGRRAMNGAGIVDHHVGRDVDANRVDRAGDDTAIIDGHTRLVIDDDAVEYRAYRAVILHCPGFMREFDAIGAARYMAAIHEMVVIAAETDADIIAIHVAGCLDRYIRGIAAEIDAIPFGFDIAGDQYRG